MQLLIDFLNFFRNLSDGLKDLTTAYGAWTNAILFAIIFAETGLVVTPFLPGDSLLFATGAIAADPASGLNILVLWGLLTFAAILGDSVNYALGRRFGMKMLEWNLPFVKPEYIEMTNAFYAKHGSKMIVLARFTPFVRTFAPFVAGIAEMDYKVFFTYNVVGGIIWTTLFLGAGFFFGQLEFVKHNFEMVAVAVVLLSLLPMVYEYIKAKRSA